MTWMKQLTQSQLTSSKKPVHLLLQEVADKCVEDVYYVDNYRIWAIGNGVWRIEKENTHA